MISFRIQYSLYLIFALMWAQPANSQEILQKKKIEFQGKGPAPSRLINLFGKDYYTTGRGGHYRLYYGGKLYAGAISDTLVDGNRQDQFFLEFDSTLEVKDYYVIDNCEEYVDHTNTDKYGVMAVQFDDEEDADSLAIMTLPEGIQLKRSDYLDRSVLIVTDSNFNYIEHSVPTTGKILQIRGGHENLYMSIRIPLGIPYILVGQDTIFNKYQPPGEFWTSLVIASYNLETKTFNWSKWIGTTDLNYIYGLQMDQEENLILLVSTLLPIELPGEDTIHVGNGVTNCVVLKFDKNGDYLWSQNFNEQSPYIYGLDVDEAGGVYLRGFMGCCGQFQFLDTVLIVDSPSQYPSISFLLKLESSGEFDWVYLIEGLYDQSSFNYLTFNNDTKDLFLSGSIDDGSFVMNDENYNDVEPFDSHYFLKINIDNGNLKGHILSQENVNYSFHNLTIDITGNLIAYIGLRDRFHFLGEELTPFASFAAGYLLRITSNWDSIVSTHELAHDLFKTYPNPVLAGQTIEVEVDQSHLTQNMKGMLIDMQGFTVKSFTVSDHRMLVSTSGLTPGMYALCVYSDGFYKSEIITVQ